VRLLHASIAGEASTRVERARELGRQARERMNADFDVNNPNTPLRASQKLIAAATLLWSMPAPSTPEAQNLHHEAQALIEQAVEQQAESSASRICQQGRARRHLYTQAARRDNQPTRAERRLGSGSLTRADRPRTATPATSSTPTRRATRTHGWWWPTNRNGVGATTAARIAR
jgi:hypothetical protein